MSDERIEWIAQAALVLIVGLVFLQAPVAGAFYWSDAPRHALNGVFVKDLLVTMPLSDPEGFAERYYVQYPALTILFYPPMFYFISAPAFAIFGVSQETALGVVMVHYIAFALGAYHLFRFWLMPPFAFCAAAVLVAAPEIAFWGRQVMLEVPAFAFATWSAVFFVAYLRDERMWKLYLAAALMVFALYTKIGVAFLALAFAAVLIYRRRVELFRDRHTYIILALALVGLAPLAWLTLHFGQTNVQSVVGIADAPVPRLSLAGWIWYAETFPSQLGPVAFIAVLAGTGALAWRWRQVAIARIDLVFWLLWLGIGYVTLTAIDLKEARHGVFILPPLVLAAFLPLPALLPRIWALSVAAVVAGATLITTVWFREVLYVDGYAAVVDRIAKLTPHNGVVVFSGYRDGAFIFNMRAREDRRDISTVRADKLLLELAVRRELGVSEKSLSQAEMADLLTRLHVSYVVAQPGFWTDLAVMKRFETVLHSPSFEEVARIPTPSNFGTAEDELVIYRNLRPLPPGPVNLEIELKMIGKTVSGTVGRE